MTQTVWTPHDVKAGARIKWHPDNDVGIYKFIAANFIATALEDAKANDMVKAELLTKAEL